MTVGSELFLAMRFDSTLHAWSPARRALTKAEPIRALFL